MSRGRQRGGADVGRGGCQKGFVQPLLKLSNTIFITGVGEGNWRGGGRSILRNKRILPSPQRMGIGESEVEIPVP